MGILECWNIGMMGLRKKGTLGFRCRVLGKEDLDTDTYRTN